MHKTSRWGVCSCVYKGGISSTKTKFNNLIMETANKRLLLLLRFIDIALLLIVASIIIPFIYAYTNQYTQKFSDFADRLPSSGKFDSLRLGFKSISYVMLIPIVIVRVLYGIVLYQIRKIVKSILSGGVFRADQASRIRKIAYYFLGFACILLFINIIITFSAYQKGNMKVFTSSLLGLVGVFERYVLTGLIGLGIAEVFISGMKIKEEQDLTI